MRFPDVEQLTHYNRHRYYDPSIGRYISADPFGQLHFFSLPLCSTSAIEVDRDVITNLFTYVENRPLVGIDPLGLAFLVAGANANAVVGGGGGGSVGAYIGWHQGAQANQGWFGTPFDAGFFGSADFSGGLDFGIGGFAGAVKSITGTSVNVNASALFFQGSASFNPCFPSNSANINSFLDFLAAAFGSFNGATAGLNVGSPVGATVGVSHTVTSTQGVQALAGALGF